MTERISLRALNRATLHRQLLLNRADVTVVEGTQRALGLNAQSPNSPYLALWSRLATFALDDLTKALEDRTLVRSTMMRATQHITTAKDFALIRPLLTPLFQRVQRNTFGSRTKGIDLDALVADARKLLADGTVLTRPQLGRALAETRPGSDPSALGWTVQYLAPIVHPAPSGTWNSYGATPFELADSASAPTLEGAQELVLRYLAAFGPARVSDARAWSGLAGLNEVVASLGNRLRTFTDEAGRELYDLPDGPRPAEDTPAPVRFVPDFDAPLLAFDDRTRMMTDDVRRQVCVGDGVAATVLVDGTVAATWAMTADTLTVNPFRQLHKEERHAIEAEGQALLMFVHAANGAVTFSEQQ